MTVVAVVLIIAGLFFLAVSAFGLIRFPDFYTRAHVVAKSESLGVALIVGGVIVYHGGGDGTMKLLLLIGFSLVANPTAIHALARAHRLEHVPVEPVDPPDASPLLADLEEDQP
jgi:multicomponent Na+:H+ antiporter subunit G